MSIPIKILARFPILQQLPPDIVEELSQVGEQLVLARQSILYHQGDPPSGLFGILTGQVKLYRQSREKTQILTVLGEGDFFGAESLAIGTDAPYTAEAIMAGSAVYIPPDDLNLLMQTSPELARVLLDLVWSRLHQFTLLVQNLAFHTVPARVADVLLRLSAVESLSNGTEVSIQRRLTYQELAEMVGTAREVIHRTLKKFEQQGMVQVTASRIILLDVEQVRRTARQET